MEQRDCLLICQTTFAAHEDIIFQEGTQAFALTGPQGFGKSAFLHYLAAKYCHHNGFLVVFVPVCPSDEDLLLVKLANAFYQACRIANLQNYRQLRRLDGLVGMLEKIYRFAGGNGKTLLLVIDQMEVREQAFFAPTTTKIGNFVASRSQKIRVVLSSSTSNTYKSVFPARYFPLKKYSHKLTSFEANLLASHFSNVSADELSEQPFQVAVEKIKGQTPSIEKARAMAGDLLRNPNAQSIQAFINLQEVINSTRKAREEDFSFATVLDPDHFYMQQDASGQCHIAEHRTGFAESVVTLMRANHADYANCQQVDWSQR